MDRGKTGRSALAAFRASAKQYKYVLLTAALGVFLLLLPSGGSGSAAPDTETAESFDRAGLQREMEEILSQIEGVGKLSLMLTVEGGGEKQLARDESATVSLRDSDEEQTRKTETVVLGSGSGAEVVVTQSYYPRFVGALVVCEGAGSASVRLTVTQAVGALTGLSSDQITVARGEP